MSTYQNNKQAESFLINNDKQGNKIVIFNLNGHEYALALENIVEIIRMVAITTIPEGGLNQIAGVINLRGEIIPVLDLRKYLYMEATPYTLNTHIVVAQVDNRKMGLVVDCVTRVSFISNDVIKSTPDIASSNKHLTGVAKTKENLLLILDIEYIFQEVATEWYQNRENNPAYLLNQTHEESVSA